MRGRLKALLICGLFWICLQVIIRAVFIIYNHDRTAELAVSEVFLVFWHGLRMDLSMSGYFVMFTALMLMVSTFVHMQKVKWILNAVSVFGVVVTCFIAVVDAELYRHWGFRLDTTPFFYLSGAGKAAVGSAEPLVVIKLTLMLGILTGASLFCYFRLIAHRFSHFEPVTKFASLPWLGISALMIIPIRGSFSVAPMNTGFVYFHKTNNFANHAAINVVWNFLYAVNKGTEKYPEDFYDSERAESAVMALYQNDGPTVRVLKEGKPNVILFILESFTADVVEPLGGRAGVTPNLSALCEEGLLFKNFYSSGDRTDKGLISILSGYPAQTKTSIIKFPSKSQRLPNLTQAMNQLGYQTSFVYGGDPDFANFRSYLTQSNFNHLTTQSDFPNDLPTGKWGVHDQFVFERAFTECDTASAPFFKVILSLSSHEPFDAPMEMVIPGADEESMFLNACHYTDHHLGEFIKRARQTDWWENTVVMVVADHGHRLPGKKELKDKARFRIPFVITGGAVTRDSVIQAIGSQTDIANTLLGQLDKPNDNFRFSKNLLSVEVNPFAAYFFNNGYGFITPRGWLVYDHNAEQFVVQEGGSPEDIETSKAYQQALFTDYNSK